MKIIFNYCTQTGRYQGSAGLCLIQLEDTETINDVRNKYVSVKREWWEQRYYEPKEMSEYIETKWNKEQVKHTGRLVLMKTAQEYLD